MWWSMNEAIKMQLSAFIDGELLENEKELLLRRLSQDAELRQQVAEYLAIGRAMRNEVQVGSINELRDRVAGAIDDKPLENVEVDIETRGNRMLRPLAGFAIAASVALVAILGLREATDIEVLQPSADTTVDTASFPTQPDADDLLRQYRLLHEAEVSDLGANSINTRLTGFELREVEPENTAETPAATTDDDAGKSAEDKPAE